MSISTALKLLLEKYPLASRQQFSGHAVADLIRRDIPTTIKQAINLSDRYMTYGSPGQGNWAKIPWVAVYDRLVTETAQDGFYVVYLVKEDFSGVYITLNQGITMVRKVYGADAKIALKVRASDYLARLGEIHKPLIKGPIDLKISSGSNLGSFYETGSICAKLYELNRIPSDEELNNDLKLFITLYHLLASKELTTTKTTEEDDETGLADEDLAKLREHKRIERNRKLADQAKKIHGYACQACGFDYSLKYGEIGYRYIEAHHLTPLHELKGEKVTLNPKTDFSVLCSNCHRMIHRSEFVGQVKDFSQKYITSPYK